MAKLTDKFFNRIIEGPLELQSEDEKQVKDLAVSAVESADGLKILENIEDAQGHKRFIEGNGSVSAIEGLIPTYCKWSLSGSHLMCVLAGTLEENAEIENGAIICTFSIPSWISEKIYNVWAEYIEIRTLTATASDWTTQTSGYVYGKLNDGRLFLQKINGSLVADKDRNFRIAFDLLIDNEAPAE
ncbi:MAG: hypothetical protein J6S67_12670 [Methanobrevibacter sp.]|nr:hypothetical protein [Methanobrevibacter sp.]